jgi:colanic acid/amylovoran biosynthesis glycosyltransferase
MFHGYGIRRALREKKKTGRNIYRKLFKRGDYFLVNSFYHWKILLKLGLNKNRSVVHYVGIDCSKFKNIKRKRAGQRKVILTVARLVPIKGLEYGLRSFGKVLKDYPGPVEYWLIGEGPLRDRLKKLADRLKIANSVKFWGAISRSGVRQKLAQADIFFLPSLEEGLGLALMEALATGLPAVASNVGGIPELIKNNLTGFLVAPKDTVGFSKKIVELLSGKEIESRIGRRAQEEICNQFDINKLNDRLEKIYQGLLD